MEPNELRIGNWATVLGSLPFEVNSNHLYMMQYYEPKDLSNEANYKEITNPILITEEWLVKFGFYLYGLDETSKKRLFVIDFGKYNYVFDFDNKGQGINSFGIMRDSYNNNFVFGDNIKYVHQLQNVFFALTGKELELK